MTEENDLFHYMLDATQRMQSNYERIQKRSLQDPGTAGDNGEENWASLLRDWLPPTYQIVTKGRIMNAQGQCSPQVDLLVLTPNYPKALIDKKEYLEAGVAAAFECKLTLRPSDIRYAVENSVKIRQLSRSSREGTPYKELNGRMLYGLLAHSHDWLQPRSKPIKNVENNLSKAEEELVRHPQEFLDVVCVSNLATWNTVKSLTAGKESLDLFKIRYEGYHELWASILSSGGVIEASHICHSKRDQLDNRNAHRFSPVGSLIVKVLVKLAWEDISLRPLTEYFINSNILGSGQGRGSGVWTLDVLSKKLTEQLSADHCVLTTERWSEWSIVYM